MRVSREQMAENRRRILGEAARLFREKGFDAVSVADVMKAAGLTHGGFYGHFASKDDLFARAVEHAIDARGTAMPALETFIDLYLSPRHRDDAAGGCAIAGLAADTLRQTPEARAAVTDGIARQIDWIAGGLPEAGDAAVRRHAIALWSAMVGATILARATGDTELSEEILTETRAWIRDGMAPREG